LNIEIITPATSLFKGEVKAVTVPSMQGPFTMLEHHAAIVAILDQGNIVMTLPDGNTQTFAIKGGFCEQHDDHVILCVEN
jgi:F-type H+-transporting ATPase subunit epsilon